MYTELDYQSEKAGGCYERECEKCGEYAELQKKYRDRVLCLNCFMEDYG